MKDKLLPKTVYFEKYEWDENKNVINIEKHSISFEAAVQIFNNIIIESISTIQNDEERILAIGVLDTKEIVVVYTNRSKRKRIISARRARENERKRYREFIQKLNEQK